jgi:hypothetical protein
MTTRTTDLVAPNATVAPATSTRQDIRVCLRARGSECYPCPGPVRRPSSQSAHGSIVAITSSPTDGPGIFREPRLGPACG